MAISMPIPPWLVTHPAEHAAASQAGLREGIQAAQIWAQAAGEKARLEEASKRSDMHAMIEQQQLQEKSIYDAQRIAVDREKSKAAIGLAQARLDETQKNAERAAQQWTQQFGLNQQKAAQLAAHQGALESQGAQRIGLSRDRAIESAMIREGNQDIARDRASEYARHNLAMEGRVGAGAGRLSPDLQPDDDLLKQRIAQTNAQLKEVQQSLLGNPRSEKWLKAQKDLVDHRNELVIQRKKLRGWTGFSPVMGGRQMADESSEAPRFSIAPVGADEEEQPTDEEE